MIHMSRCLTLVVFRMCVYYSMLDTDPLMSIWILPPLSDTERFCLSEQWNLYPQLCLSICLIDSAFVRACKKTPQREKLMIHHEQTKKQTQTPQAVSHNNDIQNFIGSGRIGFRCISFYSRLKPKA